MQADYGGTELRSALEFVLHSHNSDMSTMVFVLTDGKVHLTSSCFMPYSYLKLEDLCR